MCHELIVAYCGIAHDKLVVGQTLYSPCFVGALVSRQDNWGRGDSLTALLVWFVMATATTAASFAATTAC
jgi:hypothetical protein